MESRTNLTAIKKMDLAHLCYFMKEGAAKAKQPRVTINSGDWKESAWLKIRCSKASRTEMSEKYLGIQIWKGG